MEASGLASYNLTLYHTHPTRSVRVLWACHEVGLSVKVVPVALMQGEHRRPPFKDLNPMMAVPTLILTAQNGTHTVMTESGAIVQLLADYEGSLAPPRVDIAARATYHRWCTFSTAAMDPLLWTIRMNEQVLPKTRAIPEAAQRARQEFKDKIVPTLMGALAGEGSWIAGDFSGADILVGYALNWAKLYGLVERKELLAYTERCKDRRAFKAAMSYTDGTEVFGLKLQK